MKNIALLLIIFIFQNATLLATDKEKGTLLYGNVVAQDGTSSKKYIYMENGIIQAVSKKRPKVGSNIHFLKVEGYIYPGLIDLHSHSTYNFMPLWDQADGQFGNRFDWRKNEHYKKIFRSAWKHVFYNEDQSFYDAAVLFSELQAVAGGTTLLQQSHELDNNPEDEFDPNALARKLPVRGTDFSEDLDLKDEKRIVSIIDLFDYRKTTPPVPKGSLNFFAALRSRNQLQAFIPHLAEGRTGFLMDHDEDPLTQDHDLYSRNEFEALMNHALFSDPQNSPKPPVALIHASGIDPNNDKHIEFLKTWNMGIVWSPVSNLLLYNDTLDIETLVSKGVTIALGSDWSPSGSKHVLDEARFAKFFLNKIRQNPFIQERNLPAITDTQIFQMMTSNATKLLGLENYGALEEGNLADLVVLSDPDTTKTAMESLFTTDVRYLSLVMIGGKAVYGVEDSVKKLNLEVQKLPSVEGASVQNKVFAMDPSLKINIENSMNQIEAALDQFSLENKIDPPIRRSNLLSSSDKFYQQRISALHLLVRALFTNEFNEDSRLRVNDSEEEK